jgi:hypothetical protein
MPVDAADAVRDSSVKRIVAFTVLAGMANQLNPFCNSLAMIIQEANTETKTEADKQKKQIEVWSAGFHPAYGEKVRVQDIRGPDLYIDIDETNKKLPPNIKITNKISLWGNAAQNKRDGVVDHVMSPPGMYLDEVDAPDRGGGDIARLLVFRKDYTDAMRSWWNDQSRADQASRTVNVIHLRCELDWLLVHNAISDEITRYKGNVMKFYEDVYQNWSDEEQQAFAAKILQRDMSKKPADSIMKRSVSFLRQLRHKKPNDVVLIVSGVHKSRINKPIYETFVQEAKRANIDMQKVLWSPSLDEFETLKQYSTQREMNALGDAVLVKEIRRPGNFYAPEKASTFGSLLRAFLEPGDDIDANGKKLKNKSGDSSSLTSWIVIGSIVFAAVVLGLIVVYSIAFRPSASSNAYQRTKTQTNRPSS